MNWASLNINDEIKVKLTDEGRAIYESYWTAVLAGSNGLTPPSLALWTDDEGWISFQLWDAMAIFGPHCYNGGPILFENNTVRFPNKNSVQHKKVSVYGCGHGGFLSIYPAPDGGTQCTACAANHIKL